MRIYLLSLTESSPSIADVFFEKIYEQKITLLPTYLMGENLLILYCSFASSKKPARKKVT